MDTSEYVFIITTAKNCGACKASESAVSRAQKEIRRVNESGNFQGTVDIIIRSYPTMASEEFKGKNDTETEFVNKVLRRWYPTFSVMPKEMYINMSDYSLESLVESTRIFNADIVYGKYKNKRGEIIGPEYHLNGLNDYSSYSAQNFITFINSSIKSISDVAQRKREQIKISQSAKSRTTGSRKSHNRVERVENEPRTKTRNEKPASSRKLKSSFSSSSRVSSGSDSSDSFYLVENERKSEVEKSKPSSSTVLRVSPYSITSTPLPSYYTTNTAKMSSGKNFSCVKR